MVGSQPTSVDCCNAKVAHVDAPLNLGPPDDAAFDTESKESAYELAREASRHNPELKVSSLPLSGLFGAVMAVRMMLFTRHRSIHSISAV